MNDRYPNKPTVWAFAERASWSLDQPRLLGILNVTPDSFSDGGRYLEPAVAADAAARMVAEGADGIDVGGESTRPGAQRVSIEEQIRRVVPVIAAVRRAIGNGPAITIDTTRATVAEAALDAGADAINDVSGGTEDPVMLALAARRRCGIIVMHRLTTPENDAFSTQYGVEGKPNAPKYDGDVVGAVKAALSAMTRRALEAGVAREAIVVDPGLGFGKTVEQNLDLIKHTPELLTLGFPVLSGLSRKSFVLRVLNLAGGDPDRREAAEVGTLSMSIVHAQYGAQIFRVHDVKVHVLGFRSQKRS